MWVGGDLDIMVGAKRLSLIEWMMEYHDSIRLDYYYYYDT